MSDKVERVAEAEEPAETEYSNCEVDDSGATELSPPKARNADQEDQETVDQPDTASAHSDLCDEATELDALESIESDARSTETCDDTHQPNRERKLHKRRRVVQAPAEARLRGRRQFCKRIADIAPYMLKTVKLRILGNYLNSTKGLSDDALTEQLRKDAGKIAARDRILGAFESLDSTADLRNLKWIILIGVLLQEETYSLEESRLEEKVVDFEKRVVKRARTLDFFDKKSHEETRWHFYDTYRIVLEAAWAKDEDISVDEANLLAVLRDHLSITMEEHWAIGAYIKRFPKTKCLLHTPEEIHDARKQLQKESLLWNYRDEHDRRIDVIPYEVVQLLAQEVARRNFNAQTIIDCCKTTASSSATCAMSYRPTAWTAMETRTC